MANIKDCTEGKFKEITKFVEKHPTFRASFDQCLDQLDKICKNNPGYVCELYPDWADNSLTFNIIQEKDQTKSLLHGGFIFHGNPDESLSVCLTPTHGFRIHT